jgi:hypothetical protein
MSKKIYPQAVLKTLPEERRQAILEYLDGDGAEEKPHSFKATVAWLREDGIVTSHSRLVLFREWQIEQNRLAANEQTALAFVQDLKQMGKVTTAEEEMEAGQRFFTRLAMSQQDNLGFVRILREQTRREQTSIDRQKFEFDAAKAALKVLPELKVIAADNSLDDSAKIDKVREKLFGTLAE